MSNVPIQSLIDHIKTAIDVDPWAKEMAEELLKEHEPVRFKATRQDKSYPFWDSVCTGCEYKTSTVKNHWKYCPVCGRKVKWDEL